MNHFTLRRLIAVLCASGFCGLSNPAMAAAFQLWEQDTASIGTYHAGYAASANDASTAWYNPAGITRIPNQQLVFGANAIMSDFTYRGSLTVINSLPPPFPSISHTFTPITAQGGTFNLVPYLHYVAPLTDKLGFGFSVDVPFGLKTDYGNSTNLRYAATLTSINVVDISPSLGIKVCERGSVGFGFDVQRAYAEFNNVGVSLGTPGSNTPDTNKANDTGYGFHLGALYEFSPTTRAGVSYHSQVVHHLSGHSTFEGPIANALNGGTLESGRATANFTLPAYTALSAYHHLLPKVGVMGSVIYTQWDSFKNLTLNNVAGVVTQPFPVVLAPSVNIQATLPQNYRNSWNVSVGSEYYATDAITLRAGLGYDETPVRNAYRNVQLPDNSRYVIALGAHFLATKTVGMDLGWMHIFIQQANITPPPQVTGAQMVIPNGHVNGGADVIGGQITWDFV